MLSDKLLAQIDEIANVMGLDPKILHAIINVESACDTWKVRYEPSWALFNDPERYAKLNGITIESEKILQATSLGMGQVMGATARDLGYREMLTKLCIPKVGVMLCATYLKRLKEKYPDGNAYISAYNAGSPTSKNQEYVNKVLQSLGQTAF